MNNRKVRRSDPDVAFIPEPDSGPVVAKDALADSMGQDYLSSATSGEEATPDDHDAVQTEEVGGPFVVTTEDEELGDDEDEEDEEEDEGQ